MLSESKCKYSNQKRTLWYHGFCINAYFIFTVTLFWTLLLAGFSVAFEDETPQRYVPCKEGWFLYGEKCYKILGGDERRNWEQAAISCSREGGNLATIQSQQLNAFLTTFLLLNAEANVWIGLRISENDSYFAWDDGSDYDYRNWDLGEPTSTMRYYKTLSYEYDENCVEMHFGYPNDKTGTWNDVACNMKIPYLCEIDKSEETLSADPRFCAIEEGGGWKYLSSCYHIIFEDKTWDDAQRYCEENFDGNLVSILYKFTDAFLDGLLSHIEKGFWIGIKNENHTVQKWSSGMFAAYKNWNYGLIYVPEDTCAVKSRQNRWKTAPCSRKLPFICERSTNNQRLLKKAPEGWRCPASSEEWIDSGGEYCYIFEVYKSVTWYKAHFECRRKGGNLASIHSEAEANFLHYHVVNTKQGIFTGLHRNLLRDDEFEWDDGSMFDYQNWGDGEPNNPEEICGEVWTETMKWNDVRCDRRKGYICSVKKVPPNMTNEDASTSN